MPLKSRPLTDPDQIEDIQLRLSRGRVIEACEWDAVLALAKRALEVRAWLKGHVATDFGRGDVYQDGWHRACVLALLDGDGGGK